MSDTITAPEPTATTAAVAPTGPAAPAAPPRIPLNTLAIGLGLAGVAEAWTAAVRVIGLPVVVAQAFWAVAAIAWVWLIVAHLVRGRRSGQPLIEQLRHPAQGPLAAIVPVVGMLLGSDLARWVPVAGTVLVLASLAATALFAAWLVSTWISGRIELGAVHGGYLLPTVAAGFVAAGAAQSIGLTGLAWAAFGEGMLFWIVMTTVVILRLTTRPPLPDALVPTLAVIVAPPAVGGIALFALTDDAITPFSLAFAGLAAVLVLVQLALIPRYRQLPFSLGFWSFTFPTAALVAYTIEWLGVGARDAAPILVSVLTAVLVVGLTVFVATVGFFTVRIAVDSRSRLRAEAVLTRADDIDAATRR
ncbi:transporter [Herbiconiux sp. P17]|uniref:SLAC1 family transporter n=1 Tax=Herbiconiux wuyangfengii TaxID=3342794 RepID=UPI0035B7D7D2